jgi:hypothetical protein
LVVFLFAFLASCAGGQMQEISDYSDGYQPYGGYNNGQGQLVPIGPYDGGAQMSGGSTGKMLEDEGDYNPGLYSDNLQFGGQVPTDGQASGLKSQIAYQQQSSSPNALWILQGRNTRSLTYDVPINQQVREELAPAISGSVVIYERQPSGQVLTYNVGFARAYRKYGMWFTAPTTGTYTVWYVINNQASNTITFNAYGGWVPPHPPAPPQPGSCSVWTDKMQYGVSETITVNYQVSAPCTIRLTVLKPDGTSVNIGPRSVTAGVYTQLMEASYPLGTRSVTLETYGGMACSSSTTFRVGSDMPLGSSRPSYGRQGSMGAIGAIGESSMVSVSEQSTMTGFGGHSSMAKM